MRRLQVENAKRLDAAPSLQKFPELRGMRELIEAEWRGVRDGAHLSDAQWASHCGANYFYHRFVCNGEAMTGCSYVYFPRSEAGPLLGNNLDSTADEPLRAPSWPAISEHLIWGPVSSGVPGDEISPEIFPVPVMKLMARYCRSTPEAVEMLERYKDFWGPCNALLIDADSNVAMIEKTARRIAVRYSEDGFGFITAMAQEDASLKSFVQERREKFLQTLKPVEREETVKYWAAQNQRHALMQELLDDARQNPNAEAMRELMQFRCSTRGCVAAGGEPILADSIGGACFEHTLRTHIWQLRNGVAQVWERHDESSTPSWENRLPDVQFDDVWKWQA